MAVTDVENRDMNGFSKQKIPNLAHTYGTIPHLETLLPPQAKNSASAPDEFPCLPSYGATIFME